MKRILIADDDPGMLKILAHILSCEGYDVITESDGKGALETARRIRPDLVIVDMMMPSMSGIEVLRRLYRECEPSAIPGILLTARDPGELEAEVNSLGGVKFVSKPFDLDELVRAVKEALADR